MNGMALTKMRRHRLDGDGRGLARLGYIVCYPYKLKPSKDKMLMEDHEVVAMFFLLNCQLTMAITNSLDKQ